MPVPKFESAMNGFENRGRFGPKDRIRERQMESVVIALIVSRRIYLHALFLSRSPLLRRNPLPGLFARHAGAPESFCGMELLIRFT